MYDVAANIRYREDVHRAYFILAFCGHEMYIVKSKGVHERDPHPAKKPDVVIGLFMEPSAGSSTLRPVVRNIQMNEAFYAKA